jgi:hypothetical protein
VTGAEARTNVFLGYSLTGLNPGGLCPPALGGLCLDLAGPQLVPAQPRSDANGDADLSFVVPPFLSDMHMQAATLSPNAEVSEAVSVPVYDANPADTLDNFIDDITGADIFLDLDIGLDDTAITCTLFGICSCTASYEATATSPVRNGQALTFSGTWTQVASDCNTVLDSFIWTPSTAGNDAFHTVSFNAYSTGLDFWVVHENAADSTPVSDSIIDQFNAGQLAVSPGSAPFLGYANVDAGGLVEIAVDVLGFALDVTIDADADVTFSGLSAN